MALALPAPVMHAAAPTDSTVPMSQLPGWVQVAPRTAPLFAADTGPKGIGVQLPRHSFLRILGGGTRRLLVEPIDNNGQAGQPAWIDPDDVVPSAPGEGWRVTATQTTLWQAPGQEAA